MKGQKNIVFAILFFIVVSIIFSIFLVCMVSAEEENQVWAHFYTNNKVVNDIYIGGDILWAATDGGISV